MSRLAAIKADLRWMLGPDIGIGVTEPKAPDEGLRPEEEAAMARVGQKRQLEFASGRAAARQAMRDLNHLPMAIPMAPDRSPVWPGGLLDSITHSDDICIAAVARGGLIHGTGIDIKPDTPLSRNLEDVICAPSERAWLDTQCPDRRGHVAKQVFA